MLIQEYKNTGVDHQHIYTNASHPFFQINPLKSKQVGARTQSIAITFIW